MELKAGRPRSESIGPFRLGHAKTHDAGAWEMGVAMRYPIGWFDYAAADESEAEGAGSEEGADAGAPLAEAAALLRHLSILLQPPLGMIEGSGNALQWPAPLLPFQREGVMALTTRRELLLADSMGLGKTIQAIAALRVMIHRGDIASALIVCPAALLRQWRGELARWAPELAAVSITGSPSERGRLWPLRAQVKLIGYETLRADILDLRDSPALRRRWDLVVLDEASRIRNAGSSIAVACKLLPSERRWALTGTPLENSIDDIASIMDFLLQRPSSSPRSVEPGDVRRDLKSYQLRRRREDVLPQLPAKRVQDILIDLPPAQREAYDRAEQEGIVQLTASPGSTTIVHVLELISRLKQLCNCDPASGQSGKLQDIVERMRELVAEGQRALIFSQFTDETFGIGRAAKDLREFYPLVYTGALTLSQRAQVIEQFRTSPEHKALLLSLRAGGQGLNLQAASYVFHLDRWWNPALEDQAESRAHRMGQTYPVTVYRYICANTIEERIDAKLREKNRMFQEIVDDASLDIGSVLSKGDLFEIVGLS